MSELHRYESKSSLYPYLACTLKLVHAVKHSPNHAVGIKSNQEKHRSGLTELLAKTYTFI